MSIVNDIGVANIIIGIIALVLLAMFLLKKFKKPVELKPVETNAVEQTHDQEVISFKEEEEEKTLTLEERLELSWQFLYNITEIVMNKFSPEDRNKVEEIGRELDSKGMRYEHVISLGIKVEVNKAQNINIEKDKQQGQSR